MVRSSCVLVAALLSHTSSLRRGYALGSSLLDRGFLTDRWNEDARRAPSGAFDDT